MTREEGGGCSFADLRIDARLIEALSLEGITKPTLIQEKAIPLALLGKDILARAKTGSGKTFSYLLPILNGILSELPLEQSQLLGLIVVPTKELARQVESSVHILLKCTQFRVKCVNLAAEDSRERQVHLLKDDPFILISTPSRLCDNLVHINLSSIKYLVIDEADLVLSFGYGEDLDRVLPLLPKLKQSFLMSATITDDVEKIKALILRNAAILKLEEGDEADEEGILKQLFINVHPNEDKFLLAFAVLKLKLLRGKILIFTSTIERAYKLKIFLEEFGVRSCCLNPDFPLSARQHIVEEFNRGVFDLLVTPDIKDPSVKVNKRESGVARGVDFKRVDIVINFDMPATSDAYVHRVGRTARAGQSGTAISFVASEQEELVLEGQSVEKYAFDMTQIDGFRYRTGDALRAVTKAVVKQAIVRELKAEMANSEKLKVLMSDRPEELSALLMHNRTNMVRSQPHLKHIPEYLLPATSVPLPQTKPNAPRKVFKPRNPKFRSSDPLKAKRRHE